MSRIYNLRRDLDDVRDLLFEKAPIKKAALPDHLDLRGGCPPIWDQGDEGSCSSHAGCACRTMLKGNPALDLSRSFLYYQERALEGTTGEDSGSTIRDICKATQKYGICPSADMPYVAGDYRTAPSAQAVKNALAYKISTYKRLSDIDAVKQALVTRKQPVLTGMTVYESMESPEVEASGILPMPKKGEKQLGGHAVLIVGYRDDKQTLFNRLRAFFGSPTGYFIVRNSWGVNWGQQGYFLMPYAYFKKYAFDWWIMEQ